MRSVAPYGVLVSCFTSRPLRAATRSEWARWVDRGPARRIFDDQGRDVTIEAAPDVDPQGSGPAVTGEQLLTLALGHRGTVLVRNDRGRVRVTTERLMVEGETVVLTQFQGEVLYRLTEGLWDQSAELVSAQLSEEQA